VSSSLTAGLVGAWGDEVSIGIIARGSSLPGWPDGLHLIAGSTRRVRAVPNSRFFVQDGSG
jgi:hypothetical protein